jgi:hypothetical protein
MTMNVIKMAAVALAAAVALTAGTSAAAAQGHTTRPFSGPKVNGGTVTHTVENGKHVLTLSADFQVPDTPDPHWQVVDGKGRVFLLDRLKAKGAVAGIAGDHFNKSITLPAYIQDVVKVQIYCAWAEAVLGEAPFETDVMTVASK